MYRFVFLCVLLLSTQIFAQNVILPKQGDPITAYELVVSDAYVFYQTSLDATAQTMRIAKDDILMIRKADGSVLDLTKSTSAVAAQPETEVVQEDRFPIVDIENYHGYLLQKGNCVYIPTDSPYDYERAGQEKLKELVQNDGYWQVVNQPEQAHFVMIFHTCLAGQDMAYCVFRTRKTYNIQQEVICNAWSGYTTEDTDALIFGKGGAYSDETESGNIAAAIRIVNKLKDLNMLNDCSYFYKMYGKHSKKTKAWVTP